MCGSIGYIDVDNVWPDQVRPPAGARSPSAPGKDGYEHFMLKEIYEQPEALGETLGEWVEDLGSLVDTLGIADCVTSLRRLHIVACGSSYHAGLIGRYIIEKFVHIPVCVDMASEFRHMAPILTKGTLLVTITQSGETVDALAAQRSAQAKGIQSFAICNAVGSTAAREADSVLYTRAGREVGIAATKTFTAQIAALCLVGIALGVYRRKLPEVELQTLKSFLAVLPALIRKVLGKDEEIREIAAGLAHSRGILYLGEGINYPVALEGALKMKEVAYIHAVAYPAGEMKYGPLALVESGTPTVVLAPMDSLDYGILSTMEKVKARGGRIIAVTDAPAALQDVADVVVAVPATHPAFIPFVSTVPLQLLAYHVAVLKGHDIDRPRNLLKSVISD